MKPVDLSAKLYADLDVVPHADRTNDYDKEGTGHIASVSAEEVSRVAYSRYVAQGSIHGHDVEHWLAAEARLNAMRGGRLGID